METLGSLVDKLTIANIRIWMAEDRKRDPNATDFGVAQATRVAQDTNIIRNQLMEEIDELFVDVIEGRKKMELYKQGSTKMYGKE